MISSAILITSVIFIMLYYKPHRSVGRDEPAFRLTVPQLAEAFSEDEEKANTLYSGKVLEVEGTLKEMILNDSTLILLMGEESQAMGVSCYLNKDQKNKYRSLKRGAQVRIKGICNGMLLDIVMDKCVLLQGEVNEGGSAR